MTINDGGTLLVGDTLATDKGLTFNGGLKLNEGAILRLNDAMMEATWQTGDEIKVFTGSATGQFAEIQPATPGEGLVWDTTYLYAKGLLKVTTANSIGSIRNETKYGVVYDLGGRRHTRGSKGIYILGNKKISVY